MSLLGIFFSLDVLEIDSDFKFKLSPVLISPALVFVVGLLQLLLDLIVKFLHICSKIIGSRASKLMFLQIS
jgi:hypothetical protein